MSITITVDSAKVLASNLKKIVQPHSSIRSWAGPQDDKSNQALARSVARIIRGGEDFHSPSLELLDRIAERCSLEPWHLLLPDLDPDNPPTMVVVSKKRAR